MLQLCCLCRNADFSHFFGLYIQQGSLYPALHRLERRGWIKAKWGTSDNNRRARYYELTRAGKRQLELETEAWRKLNLAVEQVLEGA